MVSAAWGRTTGPNTSALREWPETPQGASLGLISEQSAGYSAPSAAPQPDRLRIDPFAPSMATRLQFWTRDSAGTRRPVIPSERIVLATRAWRARGDVERAKALETILVERATPIINKPLRGLSRHPQVREEARQNALIELLRDIRREDVAFPAECFVVAAHRHGVDGFNAALRTEGLPRRRKDGALAASIRVPRTLYVPVASGADHDQDDEQVASPADSRDPIGEWADHHEAIRLLGYIHDHSDHLLLVQRAILGRKWDAIAATLGWPERTLRQRYRHALILLAGCRAIERWLEREGWTASHDVIRDAAQAIGEGVAREAVKGSARLTAQRVRAALATFGLDAADEARLGAEIVAAARGVGARAPSSSSVASHACSTTTGSPTQSAIAAPQDSTEVAPMLRLATSSAPEASLDTPLHDTPDYEAPRPTPAHDPAATTKRQRAGDAETRDASRPVRLAPMPAHRARYRALLDRLKPSHRQVLKARWAGGDSWDAIGATIGIPAQPTRNDIARRRWQRALLALVRLLPQASAPADGDASGDETGAAIATASHLPELEAATSDQGPTPTFLPWACEGAPQRCTPVVPVATPAQVETGDRPEPLPFSSAAIRSNL